MKYLSMLLLCSSLIISTDQSFPYLKIALVKQDICPSLYVAPLGASVKEILSSSFNTSGPAALFTDFDTDFIIVKTVDSPECQTWKERCVSEKNCEKLKKLRTEISPNGLRAGHTQPQGDFAQDVHDIDWSQYDIVISLDISIPAYITQKHPHVLWAYYICEGGMPSHKKSLKKLIKGYDVYLTQHWHKERKLADHAIEFPFLLQNYGCLHQIFETKNHNKFGISLEIHTNYTLHKEQKTKLRQFGEVRRAGGSLPNMLKHLMKSKYFVQYLDPNSGVKWRVLGNSIIEAISSGNLVIARRVGLTNRSLLNDSTFVSNFSDLIARIEYFEKHPDEYEKELKQQRSKLNYYCFERPMTQLIEKYQQKINQT